MSLDRRMGRDYFLDAEDASDMSRPIYVPIADSFFESSIMREELPVRFVMLALIRLALRAGANGEVDIDPVMFAKSINLPEEQVEFAIKRLMEPDRSSSSPDEEGRRIVPIDPERPFRGWRLVNWARYKHIVRMANDAARKRYERAKEEKMDVSENVRERPQASENVGTKYEIRNTKNEKRNKRDIDHFENGFFEGFWSVYPRKVGKQQALKAWLHLSSEERQLAVTAVVKLAAEWKDRPPEERHFCPHAATWINGKRWQDEPEPVKAAEPKQAPAFDSESVRKEEVLRELEMERKLREKP